MKKNAERKILKVKSYEKQTDQFHKSFKLRKVGGGATEEPARIRVGALVSSPPPVESPLPIAFNKFGLCLISVNSYFWCNHPVITL